MARALTVTAVIAAFNEEDVIGPVVADLVEQGARVYLLDHGSTDGTVAEAERFRGHGLVGVERLEGTEFSLAGIIRRKELLAAELDTDWVVNADADEFRESPWPGVGFVEALAEVDRLGYNAVDFAVLNFPPVHDAFRKGDDPRESFRFYERGAEFDRLQVRCWKKPAGPLDLVSSAGHEARFAGRSVFPLRFLLRHYPIRGQAHGERKVFGERLPRFAPDERGRGWHVQYDRLQPGSTFLREPSSLTPWDPWNARVEVALRPRGVDALEEQLRQERADAEDARRQAREAGGQLSAARGDLERATAELAASRAGAAVLQADLQATRDRLTDRGMELEALRGRAGELEEQIRRGGEELRRRHEELWTAQHEADRLRGEERALQARLGSVLASRVWRWSAPLRALLDSLTR